MKTLLIRGVMLALVITLLPSRAHAQWLVFDPANFAQAVAQVSNLVNQYRWMIDQATRLPADMRRYLVPEVQWRLHDLQTAYPWARPLLRALSAGDTSGRLYLQAVDPLQPVSAILNSLPPALRQRLTNTYATIELADSVAQTGMDEAGTVRSNGSSTLQAIREMEADAIDSTSGFNSQTALLNKINGTSVLGLRIAEQSTQFLMHTLEQLIVTNKRQRDTEAKLMNATITQWRYGPAYGQNLFRSTATDLDTWRQY